MVKQSVRRILATLLSVMMVAGTGTVNVFADEATTVIIEGSSSIEGAQSVVIDGSTGKVTVVNEPQAAKCTCDPVPGLSGNMPHLPNCPTLPVEVGELMKLIDSLPTADEITDETTPEDRAVFADDFAAAMDAYANVLDTVKEMTEDKLTALLGTERMSKLTALMGKLTAATTLENTQMGEVINQALDFTATNPPADCTKVGHNHTDDNRCFTWKDNKLTLNWFKLVAPADSGFGIKLPDGATVYTTFDSSVTCADNATDDSYGIYGIGKLNFDGSGLGTLTVKSSSIDNSGDGSSHGILAGSDIKISRCKINTSGGKTTGLGSSFGVFSQGTVELRECTLTATGDEATLSSAGIVAGVSLETINSYITAKGVQGSVSSIGISAGEVSVIAGTLTATGGESKKSYGIYVANNIYIGFNNATVEAGEADEESIGIYSEQGGYLKINNNCKVTVKGGEAASSYGVSTGTITISNGGTLESSSSGTGATAQAVTVDPNGKVEVASKDSEGTVPETYDASKLSEYKYMKVTMSLTINKTLDFVANGETSDCTTYNNGVLGHTHAPDEECFTWDKDSKTLTLNGLNLATPDTIQKGIKLPDGAKVDVADDTINNMTVGKADENTASTLCCIYGEGTLTVTGGGTLNLTGGEAATGSSYGISSDGNLSFTGSGTVNTTGGKASSLSYGICSMGTLTIDSGTVNANGGESESISAGVGSNNGTIVKGGTLTATGGKSASNSFGMNNGRGITVSGGTLTAIGGEVTGEKGASEGISIGGELTVSDNGTVTATGGKVIGDNGKTYGVYCWDKVTVSGNGKLTATGGEATAETYGIYYVGSITISDSGNVTAKGGVATADNGKAYGLDGSGATVSGSGKLTATGGKAPTEACGINGSVMVKDSGNVTAEGGVATADNGKSYGIYSQRTDIIDSGKLTATGGEAIALGGESYGLYINSGYGEFKGSGTLTATGGSANKYSYGLYCSGTNNISDTFKLTANGGETTHPEGMSSGICGKGNSLIQFFGSCTVNATGGKAANESNGVSCEKLFFYNGTLNATGGLASNSSYGVNASVSVILLDGVLVASATDNSKIAQATNIKIDVSEYNGAMIAASTSADGSNSEEYAESKHDNYKYIMVDVDKTKIYKVLDFFNEHPEDSTCITYNNGNLRHTHAAGEECFSWNKDSSTLTLNGMELIAPTGGYIGIFLPGGAKVETAPGTVNSVTAGKANHQGNSQGIFCIGKLTFSGSGTLTSTGNEVKSETGGSYGIRSNGGEIIIGGSGTVNAIGGQSDNGDSYGIEATGLTVNGGTLVAKTTGTGATAQAVSVAPNTKDYVGDVAFTASVNATGTPETDYKDADIATYKYLKVGTPEEDLPPVLDFVKNHEDSTCLTYPGLKHTHDDGKACFTWDRLAIELTLSGLDLTAPDGSEFAIKLPSKARVTTVADSNITGGKVPGGDSCGILGEGELTFGGNATLNVKGGEGKTSEGIRTGKSITFQSGTLNATGGNAETVSSGILGNNMILWNATLNATGGTANQSVGINSTLYFSIVSKGTAKAIGGNVTSSTGESYGIMAKDDIPILDGTLEASSIATTGTARAVSIAPDAKDYVGGAAFTASVNATGTPETDYKAADIATYKYLKVDSKKLASDVDSDLAGTKVVVDEGKLAGAVDTGEELGDPDVTTVKVVLAVKKNDNKPDEDKIKEALNDPNVKADTIGAFFDITLSKQVTKKDGRMETKPVTEAQTPITITITIPEAIRGHENYQVIRVHKGNAEALETTNDGNNLSFDTGMFSTYAIAYTKDETPPTPPIPPVTTGGGSDSSYDDGYSYWMGVKNKVNTSAKGDVVKTDAKSYDQLPASVMTALLDRGVGIVIEWKGGKTITIPAGKALKPEAGRLYYPLSLLEQQFGGMSIVDNTVNPETGGSVYLDAKTGTTMPVTGIIVEAPTAETAPNAPIVITPPTAGMEPEAAAASAGNMTFAVFAALAAALAGGIWYYRRKYGTK